MKAIRLRIAKVPEMRHIDVGRGRILNPATALLAWIALVFGTAGSGCAFSQVVVNAGSVREEIHVTSLKAMRDAGVVKQGFDYSCGAASLATLLTYGLNEPVTEDALLRQLLEPLSHDQLASLEQNGLSLFDLQQLAQKRGFKAQGFRIQGAQFAKLNYPVIVYIKPHGYNHFAVFKGVRGDRVYMADPTLGNVRMPIYRFLDMWADKSGRGVIFAVEKADGIWPERFQLQLAAGTGPPIEVLSAERMSEIGKPFPLTAATR
jgi:predicted double-glycine peptidase